MKKINLALAAALGLAFAATAQAQTAVTLYGVVDAAISVDKTGRPGESATTRVLSGVMQGSRFGLRVDERLSDTLTARANFEAGFQSDTGAFGSGAGLGSQAVGFNRRSVVGLQHSGLGSIDIGRDYTPFFWAQVITDVGNYGLNGNLLSILGGTLTSEQFLRASNGLFYTSPVVNGFTGRLMYSAGNELFRSIPGATPAAATIHRGEGRMLGAGGSYETGGLLVTGAIQDVEIGRASGLDSRRDSVLGVRFNGGQFTVNGGIAAIKNPGADNDARQLWLGGSITVGPAQTRLMAQVNQISMQTPLGRDAKATTLGLTALQPLSRRTQLYLSYGRVNNNDLGALPLFSADNIIGGFVPNTNPSSLSLGIRHAF